MTKLTSLFLLCSSMAVFGSGCSSSSDAPTTAAGGGAGTSTDSVQVFSWWTGPGEAEALQALIKVYKSENNGAGVGLDPHISPSTWSAALSATIDKTPTPYDVFQLAAADLPGFKTDHPGSMMPVDKYYNDPALTAAVIPEIRARVTLDDGHAYGVVTGVHRNNSFFYNMKLFKDNSITPPATMADFLTVCEKLKANGVTPVATTFQTWALHIMFDEILAGTMGATNFDDFVQGRQPPKKFEADITTAIATFGKVLSDYVDVVASTKADYGWTQAADDLQTDKAAMLMHGDWAKGYVLNLGWTAGVDFGLSGPPGANDLFVYGADVIALSAGAPHPELADKFLAVVASKEGQVAFNHYKGATPMRTDVRDQLDDIGKASLDALSNAKVLSPSHANSTWDDAIGVFAMDGDQAKLLNVYLTTAP